MSLPCFRLDSFVVIVLLIVKIVAEMPKPGRLSFLLSMNATILGTGFLNSVWIVYVNLNQHDNCL